MHVDDARRRAATLRRDRWQKLALASGFLAFAIAIAVAYGAPPTGYEQSIYAATPVGYWAATAVAVLLGTAVAVTATGYRRDAAHLLVAIGVLSVLALPAIRGYYFYGAGDSMTHLGWAREIRSGVWTPLQSLYPGVHVSGVTLEQLAGIPLRRALLLLPLVVFPLAFVTFLALDVATVSNRQWAATVGLLSAMLFVPINGLTIHPMAHPSSQAIMFVPLVIYLLFRHLTAPTDSPILSTPSSIAFGIVGIAIVFYHPQETMDVVAMLLAIAAVQFAARRWDLDERIANHRSIQVHTIVLGIAFLVWTFRHPRAQARTRYVVRRLLGDGPQTLQQAGTWSASLEAVGGSTEMLFLKLFGVTVLFGLLAVALGLWTLHNGWRRVRSGSSGPANGGASDWNAGTSAAGPAATANGGDGRRRDAFVTYLVAGLVPPTLLMGFVFVADQGDHYFRFLGFLAVPITILGAVAIAEGVEKVGIRTSGRAVAVGLCALFAVLLLAQAATFHQSPYMYKSSQQVTESSVEGYETAFEYRESETPVMGIRGGPRRYVDAIYGTETADASPEVASISSRGVTGRVFSTNMTTAFENDRYLAIEDGDYRREVELYRGLRYTEAGFERLDSSPRVDRVLSNGDVELYHIAGNGTRSGS